MLADAPIPYTLTESDNLTERENQVRWFWEQLDQRSADECWLWAGPGKERKYTAIRFGRCVHYVAKIALHLATGRPLSSGQRVSHTCKEANCCNPRHLEWRKVGGK